MTSRGEMIMTTFVQNLEPLMAAAELYAAVEEEWKLLSSTMETIDDKVWDKFCYERKQAIDCLCAASIEYAKWGRQ